MTFLSYLGDDPAKIREMADGVFAIVHMMQSNAKSAISRADDLSIALRRYAELLESLEEIKTQEYDRGYAYGFNNGFDEGYEQGIF